MRCDEVRHRSLSSADIRRCRKGSDDLLITRCLLVTKSNIRQRDQRSAGIKGRADTYKTRVSERSGR